VLQAGGEDEIEYDVLVAAVRRRGARGDDSGEPACGPVPVGAAQDVGDLADVGQALGLRLADRPLQTAV
jgi:hypothetical protein